MHKEIGAAAVIAFFRAQAADHGNVFPVPGQARKVFAEACNPGAAVWIS